MEQVSKTHLSESLLPGKINSKAKHNFNLYKHSKLNFFFVSHCIFFFTIFFFKALKIKLATKAFSSIPNTKYVYLNVNVCECKWLRFLSMPADRYLKLVVRINVCDYLCRLTENGSTVRDFWL